MNRVIQSCSALLAILGAAIVNGCDSKAPGGDIASKPSAEVKVKPEVPPKADPPVPKTDIDRSKLAIALQSDAYRYSGLNNPKPLDMEMTTKPDRGTFTGAWSTRMTQVDNVGATFIIERTGSLNQLFGNETDKLKADGLYVVSSDKEQLSSPQLELPTGFSTGKSWLLDTTVKTEQGKTMREKMKVICKGPRSIKIGSTTYATMFVEGSGSFKGDGVTARVVEREWFVKDIGMVKMEMVQTPKGKPTVTFDMIWKPADSKTKS